MKNKIASLTLILTLLLALALPSLAVEIPGYEGGINNENNYKEVIFITGEPIELEGTLDIKISEKNRKGVQTKTYTYKYDLHNVKLGATLRRNITLSETFETNGNQTTSQKTLDKYSETFRINGKTYQVQTDDYQWNQGQVLHQTGLLEYYAGDWSARKTYKVGNRRAPTEEVTVQTIGNLVGYDSPWSATQTQTLHYIIEFENKLEENDSWEGTATVEASYNKTKDYNYIENIPNQISFHGGFMLTEKHENVLKYSYNLPRFQGSGRNIGQDSMTIDTNPIITRLNIPALRDVRGLEAEKDILLIASMDGFSLTATNLGPHTAVSRGDFARALANTMDIELPEEETTTSRTRRSRRNKEEETPLRYIDVPKSHRNYPYIEGVSNRGIMIGVGKGRFEPDRELTKAEATTILIRLLGFQNLAPIGNYSTGFADDSSIPAWAKDHVYIAKELNIIPRDEYFYPNKPITKEETATLLVNFINYLQKQLKYDYRENILN